MKTRKSTNSFIIACYPHKHRLKTLRYFLAIIFLTTFFVACDQPPGGSPIPTPNPTRETVETPTLRLDGAGEDLDSSQTEPFPVTSDRSVTITSSTNGATIYYSTNGDDPGETDSTRVTVTPTSPDDPPSATLSFTGRVTSGTPLTIRVIAVKADLNNSEPVTVRFTVSLPPVATPTLRLNGAGEDLDSSQTEPFP